MHKREIFCSSAPDHRALRPCSNAGNGALGCVGRKEVSASDHRWQRPGSAVKLISGYWQWQRACPAHWPKPETRREKWLPSVMWCGNKQPNSRSFKPLAEAASARKSSPVGPPRKFPKWHDVWPRHNGRNGEKSANPSGVLIRVRCTSRQVCGACGEGCLDRQPGCKTTIWNP